MPARPRLPSEPYSTASTAAPPHSPPTATPCRNRRTSSVIGAATPMTDAPGSAPIATVEKPISSSV